jgi:hypothetical protein
VILWLLCQVHGGPRWSVTCTKIFMDLGCCDMWHTNWIEWNGTAHDNKITYCSLYCHSTDGPKDQCCGRYRRCWLILGTWMDIYGRTIEAEHLVIRELSETLSCQRIDRTTLMTTVMIWQEDNIQHCS